MYKQNYNVLASYEDEDGNIIETRVDLDTGEIVDYISSREERRELSYPLPIDITEISGREQFKQLVKERIGRRKYQLWVGDSLLDLSIDKTIHPSVLAVFCYLGRNISYNNMVYTTTGEIVDGVGHKRETVVRAIEKLEKLNLIIQVDLKLEKQSDRMVLINPRYFFLGYYPYRQVLIKQWYKGE